MICFFSSNCSSRKCAAVRSFILFVLIFLGFSLTAESVPSRPSETIYERQNTFPQKFFLKIDNGLITLIARNNPLGPLLEEIGRRSDIEIKISPALRLKKITVTWKGIPFEEGVKKIASDSGLLFRKDEDGIFSLSELQFVPESPKRYTEMQEKDNPPAASKKTPQATPSEIDPAGGHASGASLSQNIDIENDIVLHDMVIRFKQDLSEKDINRFLSDANIKVKKYIAALKCHILSLPEGMTYYDAMILLNRKEMLYRPEPKYLIPVK